MLPRTLQEFHPYVKFSAEPHCFYVTARRDKARQKFPTYYKLTNEDIRDIIKGWPEEFQNPVDEAELSDIVNLGTPITVRVSTRLAEGARRALLSKVNKAPATSRNQDAHSNNTTNSGNKSSSNKNSDDDGD